METDPEKLRLLSRWKDALRGRHTVSPFAQGEDLAVQVTVDLSRARNDLAEARAGRLRRSTFERPPLSDEIEKLVSEAIDRGLNEDAVLSVIRRSLASVITAEAHTGPGSVFRWPVFYCYSI